MRQPYGAIVIDRLRYVWSPFTWQNVVKFKDEFLESVLFVDWLLRHNRYY